MNKRSHLDQLESLSVSCSSSSRPRLDLDAFSEKRRPRPYSPLGPSAADPRRRDRGARGITSRFVLKAFARADGGHLWSVDLPPPRATEPHEQIGIAVPRSLTARWTYVRGSSRRRLPKLLDERSKELLREFGRINNAEDVRRELG